MQMYYQLFLDGSQILDHKTSIINQKIIAIQPFKLLNLTTVGFKLLLRALTLLQSHKTAKNTNKYNPSPNCCC